MTMTYQEMFDWTEKKLMQAGIEEYHADAWILMSYYLNMDRSAYCLHQQEEISEEKEKMLQELQQAVEKRCRRIPVQYIIGEQEFMGLSFLVNENVLIPRYDTEVLAEKVIAFCKGKTVLDVCTGSGCLAISIAKLGKPAKVDALDISLKALQVAEKNAKNLDARVNFFQSDMFQSVSEQYDCLVSNPPYIESAVIQTLSPEVKVHEPSLALDGGEDGLDFYRNIASQGKKYLKTGGMIFLEIGYNQGQEVSDILAHAGYHDIKVYKDYAGLDRVITAN